MRDRCPVTFYNVQSTESCVLINGIIAEWRVPINYIIAPNNYRRNRRARARARAITPIMLRTPITHCQSFYLSIVSAYARYRSCEHAHYLTSQNLNESRAGFARSR